MPEKYWRVGSAGQFHPVLVCSSNGFPSQWENLPIERAKELHETQDETVVQVIQWVTTAKGGEARRFRALSALSGRVHGDRGGGDVGTGWLLKV